MLVYVKRQRYIICQIWNQTQKRVFFCALPWRRDNLKELIHQCDASLSLNQEIWGRICQSKTTRPQLMQKKNNFNSAMVGLFQVKQVVGVGAVDRCVVLLLFYTMETEKVSCQISWVFAQSDDVMGLWILFLI